MSEALLLEPLLNDPLTIKCSKLYAVTAAKSGGVQAAFDCVLKEKPMNSNQLRLALALALCVVGGTAFAEDGVSDGKIVFGQVAALQGPAQALGQGMRQGILAAFDAANRAGGISRP